MDDVLLIDALEEAASLVQQHGSAKWANKFREHAALLKRQDYSSLKSLRGAFGGIGSLNDWNLGMKDPENERRVIESPDDKRFQELLQTIRSTTSRLVSK